MQIITRFVFATFLTLSVNTAVLAQSVGNASNFVAGSVGGVCGSNFAQDSFSGTSGTALTSHTDDCGNSWSIVSCGPGHFNLDGSGSVIPTNTSFTTCYAVNSATATSANYTVSASGIQPPSASSQAVGLYARFVSGSGGSGYIVIVSCSSANMRLFRVDNGTRTQIGSTISISCPTGTNTMSLVVNGTSITGHWNLSTVSATDSTYASGGLVGIVADSASSSSTQTKIGATFEAHP